MFTIIVERGYSRELSYLENLKELKTAYIFQEIPDIQITGKFAS